MNLEALNTGVLDYKSGETLIPNGRQIRQYQARMRFCNAAAAFSKLFVLQITSLLSVS